MECADRATRRRTSTGPISLLTFALLLILLLLAPSRAVGQALVVKVHDATHPIAGATVTVLAGDRVLARVVTDSVGIARATRLVASTALVRVQAVGYAQKEIPGVDLTAGPVASLDVLLEVDALALEGLTVETNRIQIERKKTDFSTQVQERAIQLLPVAHTAVELVALTPGARPGNVWGGANFQANSYRIDGVAANNPGMGGSLIEPNVNWIERVDVRGLGAGAEFGGFQGGLIDVVTKRGTDRTQGFVRSTYENDAIASTNLIDTEIGREVAQRLDVEAEARGPLIRDRLFYYVSGKRLRQTSDALNHLRSVDGRYAPFQEGRTDDKLFAKLTWEPGPTHMIQASGAYTDVRADNYEMTGYEGSGATFRFTSPTLLLNGSWTEALGDWGTFEVRANHFSRDERHDSYQGEDVPGIEKFSLTPPYTAFGNAPYTLRSNPVSTSVNGQLSVNVPTGPLTHNVKIGAEYTRGSFLNQRIRNGGVTWLGYSGSRFDATDPATWHSLGSQWVMSEWGGEVHLDADVSNEAAWIQSSLDLGPRLALTPGLRWNRWTGWMTPRSGDRFQAVQAQGLDPRIGLSVDLTGNNTFVAKAHWGRYHQSLISQMFDRVGGSDVFTNREFWWYTRGDLSDPATKFTVEERDALAAQNGFRSYAQETLNETGPVDGYSQPYIDEWLVGLEKEIGGWLKFGALYTRRSNKDMVALVDLNRASNYTRFERVRVFDATGNVLPFSGGSTYLQELWVPNYTIRDRLRCLAHADCPGALPVPGLTPSDTANLTWDPRYVLTKAPDAKRDFHQLQLTMEVSKPDWGMSVSVVHTSLQGNLDNVSGYTDPDSYDAGPYVRVNEAVNAYGALGNYSNWEQKLSIWGVLPWNIRGGAFYLHRSGDHYSPQYRLYGLGTMRYKVNTGALLKSKYGTTFRTEFPGQEIDYQLLYPLEGHRIFVGPRGLPRLKGFGNLDLRVERLFRVRDRDLSVSVDVFNLFRDRAVTLVNTMINNGPDYGYPPNPDPLAPGIAPNQYYKAPQERVRPRSLRVGVAYYFN